MIVTLIGYRGCGKSSVAPLLANQLHCRWIDSDHQIERQAACSIQQIFDQRGEEAFRQLEEDVLKQLLHQPPLVIAAGGGAVLRQENRQRMQAAGVVVWLQARPETLARRIAGDVTTADRRPSLTGQSVTDEVSTVLQERLPVYRDAATMEIGVDDLTPAEVADEILRRLKAEKGRSDDRG